MLQINKIFTLGLLELDKITQDDLLECINKKAELMQFITESEYYEILMKVDDNGKLIRKLSTN